MICDRQPPEKRVMPFTVDEPHGKKADMSLDL